MSTINPLSARKTAWKLLASEDLEATLEQLFQSLREDSFRYEEALMLNGELHQLNRDQRKGILDYSQLVLYRNRIRVRLVELIQLIEAGDLQGSGSEVMVEEIDTAAIIEQEADPLESLLLLEATERSTMAIFPRVYRRVREIQVRQEKSPSVTQIVRDLKAELPVLRQFAKVLEPIDAIIKQVRMESEEETIWIRYRRIKDFAADLEPGDLAKVGEWLKELEALAGVIRRGGWIK